MLLLAFSVLLDAGTPVPLAICPSLGSTCHDASWLVGNVMITLLAAQSVGGRSMGVAPSKNVSSFGLPF